MNAEPLTESSPASEPFAGPTHFNLLDVIQLLRSSAGELLARAMLYLQLGRVEWAEQKRRLLQILVATLLGFACLLCLMLFTGVMVAAFAWETVYRIPAVVAVILFYALGMLIAWRKLHALSEQSAQAFAATREELAADIALFKSKLL